MKPVEESAPWRIDPARSWPPGGAIRPPLSPTNLERLRLCWLQATFRASPGYPPRGVPSAVLGTAFHGTLQHLPQLIAEEQLVSAVDRRARAVAYFRAAVQRERARALSRPRERKLPWRDDVIQEMTIQIGIAAGNMSGNLAPAEAISLSELSAPEHLPTQQPTAVRETTLTSRDGLVAGRPDHVELTAAGPIIIDYKTGKLDNPERIASYRRQCILYAWLWHETHGEWPIKFRLVHQISGVTHSEAIDPVEAQALGEAARALAAQLATPPSPAAQASTGPHCTLCAYRPWCEPFWESAAVPYHAPESGHRAARWTFAATLDAPADRRGNDIFLAFILNDRARVTIEASQALFPHLSDLSSGARVRILDAVLIDELMKTSAGCGSMPGLRLIS